MTQYPEKIVSGAIIEEGSILLCLRKNTQVYDGHWSLPVGHCEISENGVDTLRRELYEEIGIQVIDSEFVTRLFDNEKGIEHLVYRVLDWRGGITNREPELCEDIGWFPLDAPPQPLTPATQIIIEGLK